MQERAYQGPYQKSYSANNSTSHDTCHKLYSLKYRYEAKYSIVDHISLSAYSPEMDYLPKDYMPTKIQFRHKVRCRHIVRLPIRLSSIK